MLDISADVYAKLIYSLKFIILRNFDKYLLQKSFLVIILNKFLKSEKKKSQLNALLNVLIAVGYKIY